MGSRTPSPPRLSLQVARTLVLRSQGLWGAPRFGSAQAGALRAMEHLGYVQIDPIHVVERAHHHILWSRVPDYVPAHLDELQRVERQVFEYWMHAASYVPLKDYRFSLPRMKAIRSGKQRWYEDKPVEEMKLVLKRIRQEGGLGIREFEERHPGEIPIWHARKPAKQALEELLHEGRLMIDRRRGTEKIYDLTERVRPDGVDLTVPTTLELLDHRIDRALRSNGVFSLPEATHLQKADRRKEVLARVLSRTLSGDLMEVEVEGSKLPHWMEASRWEAVPSLTRSESADRQEVPEVRILSPFDPLVLLRKRLGWLFGFDYTLECYVTESKRAFGHFCLPLLWGERFVGRLDARADRPRGVLEVRKIWWESGFDPSRTSGFGKVWRSSLESYARFNRCGEVKLPGMKKTRRKKLE